MAVALEWVGRILAISAVMVVPGLTGQWLDRRMGTQFLTLFGFGFGLVFGIWGLLIMTSRRK